MWFLNVATKTLSQEDVLNNLERGLNYNEKICC